MARSTGERHVTLVTLLLHATHRMIDELIDRVVAAGYPDIRPSDSRVFENLDPSFGNHLVGAFASTGARGTRLGYGLVPFSSGVGYPDYAVFGEELLRSGDDGVLAAGWFDGGGALRAGGFLRREGK